MLVDETGFEPVQPGIHSGALPLELSIHLLFADKERFELSTPALTRPRSAVELSIRDQDFY